MGFEVHWFIVLRCIVYGCWWFQGLGFQGAKTYCLGLIVYECRFAVLRLLGLWFHCSKNVKSSSCMLFMYNKWNHNFDIILVSSNFAKNWLATLHQPSSLPCKPQPCRRTTLTGILAQLPSAAMPSAAYGSRTNFVQPLIHLVHFHENHEGWHTA